MQLDGVAPVFCLGIGLHGFIFKWQFGKRSASGPWARPLWVSTGGRCGYVVKLGVLQACPHIHADPLLIHQAAQPQFFALGVFWSLVFWRVVF